MPQLFTNNAWSFLNGGINDVTTSIALTAGTGARFPNPTGGDFFLLTLIGLDGNGAENSWEIVKVTARATDTLTVVRAQEGTTAVAWASGTRAELRFTAAQAAAFEAKLSTADIGTSVQAYNANYTRTDLANTFVNGQTIRYNNDAATETVGLRLDRLSASPAAGDYLTSIRFSGRNSSAVLTEFVSLRPNITNIGAGTEAGQLEVLTLVNNTMGYCAVFAEGVVLSAPTGGDKGRGTLNAVNLYVQGSAVLKQSDVGTNVQAYSATLTGWADKTVPAGIVIGDTDGATLYNKTLVGHREVRSVMTANDINVIGANLFTKTISGATTFTVSNVSAAGTVHSFILDLTNGGSAAITWWAGVKWAGGVAPVLTASGRDVLGFYTHDGGTIWTGLVLGKDVK